MHVKSIWNRRKSLHNDEAMLITQYEERLTDNDMIESRLIVKSCKRGQLFRPWLGLVSAV